MASSEIILQIKDAMKAAMRAKEKQRLQVIRQMQAEFKRIEVDERIELDDARVLVVLDKMTKQRRDSAQQYTEAQRPELAEQENYEISVISDFLPAALNDDEIAAIIERAITDSGASSMQEMGKVMGLVKPQVQGRADMGAISGLIKAQLG